MGIDHAAVGVLQVLNKRGGPFTAWDEELVQTFGAHAGVAVQRQLLLDEYTKKQRMERDLSLARAIQQGLLPQHEPAVAGYDLAGWNRPADETGGDFFDFQKLPDGRLAVMIADATGHGIGPALIAAECRALLRATLSLTPDIDRALNLVNDLLAADMADNRFVTAFCGLLTPAADEFQYLSAGQGPILFYEAKTDTTHSLPAQGPPLGVAPELPYDRAQTVRLAPGDLLILFTDGFFEWPNPEGEQFGMERVHAAIRNHHALPAAEFVQHVYQSLLDFTRGAPQLDDLTAVVITKR
jgi:phosphoserine phosphatase